MNNFRSSTKTCSAVFFNFIMHTNQLYKTSMFHKLFKIAWIVLRCLQVMLQVVHRKSYYINAVTPS